MLKPELLAPAGNFTKLKTAVYFGADAVYLGGKNFSLRALSDNFTEEEMEEAVAFAHEKNVKIYVTVNIFAKNYDFAETEKYFRFLERIKVDAVLITDVGLIAQCRSVAPNLKIHLSTQANTLNKYAVKFWRDLGIERVVLARELSLAEIKEIKEFCPDVQIEAFAHGAMCISYSGRCLLSNYFNGRDANKGECVQACRWSYELREKSKDGDFFPIEEDGRGSYILNSKDLNMIGYIGQLIKAGVSSFKIEGRMKSEYYLATVVNAYRRAIDDYCANGGSYDKEFYLKELKKTNHRAFTTAYMLGDNDDTLNYGNSQSAGEKQFAAVVLDEGDGKNYFTVEMRSRFQKGDELEILSPSDLFNKKIVVEKMTDEEGEPIEDAKIVQQRIRIYSDVILSRGDILRK